MGKERSPVCPPFETICYLIASNERKNYFGGGRRRKEYCRDGERENIQKRRIAEERGGKEEWSLLSHPYRTHCHKIKRDQGKNFLGEREREPRGGREPEKGNCGKEGA